MSKDKSFRALLQRLDQGHKLGIYLILRRCRMLQYFLFSEDRH